jgi:GMP synthase (glutamine-hydrolysing)
MNLKLLVVEGNLIEENRNFKRAGIETHTESLSDSLNFFNKNINLDVVNPSSDKNIMNKVKDLNKYDGLIWGGSSLNIYNNTEEIKRQIYFMRECQNKIKKILAICWGMQVAVKAVGGEVKKSSSGFHIGIANDIEINEQGLIHPLYKSKKKLFNSPAFNFDEVVTLPENAVCLASNKINKIQSIYMKKNHSEIWGLQYHPEITYGKMIKLINFRKDRLINFRKVFNDENQIKEHITFIEKERSISNKEHRMTELKNWLKNLNEN